ncbi:hypothetical protein [Legionella saoudiensis]|uniref:hypothetical protein n=1 Tax=Legionella saoudiensis TaxID=1750561 RepID=UPI000B05010A|nr:hypothetical protein [Legionella saoudiensis]
MANYIVKILNNGKNYYLIWDTNVDAPAIYGCSLRALKDYYQQEYGVKSLHDFS